MTFANGGDNIGIYAPLFAASSAAGVLAIIGVFAVVVGVWCYSGYLLTRIPAVKDRVTQVGHVVAPFVFIALGLTIVLEMP